MNPVTSASMLADMLASRYVAAVCDLDQSGIAGNAPTIQDLLVEARIEETVLQAWLLESPVLMAVVFFARAVETELNVVKAELNRLDLSVGCEHAH